MQPNWVSKTVLAPLPGGYGELNIFKKLGGCTSSDINDGTEVDIAEPPTLFGGSVEGNVLGAGRLNC